METYRGYPVGIAADVHMQIDRIVGDGCVRLSTGAVVRCLRVKGGDAHVDQVHHHPLTYTRLDKNEPITYQ